MSDVTPHHFDTPRSDVTPHHFDTPRYALMMASLDHVFPFQWPAGLPLPAAYYWFADGAGRSLMESVSGGRAAGSVVYEASDQPTRDYPGANWLSDPHFGSVIGCGSMETGQKDTLQLADVAYGASGAFTINLWLRNPRGSDFAGREREQLFGHGNASLTTSSRNQVHVQLENSGRVRTIVTDSTDVEHEDGASTDTDPATGVDLDDGAWHMYTLTTRPDGRKGYTVYIDAEARAASPFVAGLGVARPTADGAPPSAHGGAPIDPVGTMRLCRRAKPGEWTGEAGERFDDERYFMGALSHFAVFGAAPETIRWRSCGASTCVRSVLTWIARGRARRPDGGRLRRGLVACARRASRHRPRWTAPGERLAQDHGVACARRRPRHQPDELLPGRFRGRVVAACDLAGQRLRRSHPDAGVAQTLRVFKICSSKVRNKRCIAPRRRNKRG